MTASRIALLSMPPQCSRRSRRTAPASPASLTLKLGIPLLQKPAARPDRESRDQTRDDGEGQMPRHSKADRSDDTGNAQHQKMHIEHAAQQPGDFRDIELHQQESGRRQKEVTHWKKQDDNGSQGDGVRHHATSPSLSDNDSATAFETRSRPASRHQGQVNLPIRVLRCNVAIGALRRGRKAFLRFRAADDRDFVRFRVSFLLPGTPGDVGRLRVRPAELSSRRAVFYTTRALPRRMRAGRYVACVTAWDKASNQAKACAPYRIR